jgi:putative copper export protein
MPDTLSVVCRALSFILMLQAAGLAIFVAGFGPLMPHTLVEIRRAAWLSGLIGWLFAAARQGLEASRMAADLAGFGDVSLQLVALRSSTGLAFAVQSIGLLLLVGGFWAAGNRGGTSRGTSHAWTATALVPLAGAMVTVMALALTGHVSVNPHRYLASILLVGHLLIVAFWMGALASLYLSTLRESPAAAVRLIDAFSLVAVWVIPGIFVLGVGLGAVLIPRLQVLSQPYGQLLLTKAALFAGLMGLAALNKWLLAPGIRSGGAAAIRGFRRTVLIEALLICIVLAVTSVMTTFFSPEAA